MFLQEVKRSGVYILTHTYLTRQVRPSAEASQALFEDDGVKGRVLAGRRLSDQVPCEQRSEGSKGARSVALRRASTSARVS